MFTVRVEDIDEKIRGFEAKEYGYQYEVVQTMDELEEIFKKWTEGVEIQGEFLNLNVPQTKEEFYELKKEIYNYFRNDNKSEGNDPIEEIRVRVGNIELFNKPGYKNISIFASRIYIMNEEGQTVDQLNLLR